MNMVKLINEKELLKNLFYDVKNCHKKRIVFLGGHFPLIYSSSQAIEAINQWGVFSKYTLELACKVAKFAKQKNKKVKFVFFVDDHVYEPISGLNSTKLSSLRNKLYKLRSGEQATLPEEYSEIMKKYGFSEKDTIRQDQRKPGRNNCLYFSEKILRASNIKIKNDCAREYIAFLENEKYFSKKNNYIISFIPQRCKNNICSFAIPKIKNLKSSHIFIDSMEINLSKKKLYTKGTGIIYRKDL